MKPKLTFRSFAADAGTALPPQTNMKEQRTSELIKGREQMQVLVILTPYSA